MSEDELIQPPKPEREPDVEPEQEPEAEPLRTWRYQLAGAGSFDGLLVRVLMAFRVKPSPPDSQMDMSTGIEGVKLLLYGCALSLFLGDCRGAMDLGFWRILTLDFSLASEGVAIGLPAAVMAMVAWLIPMALAWGTWQFVEDNCESIHSGANDWMAVRLETENQVAGLGSLVGGSFVFMFFFGRVLGGWFGWVDSAGLWDELAQLVIVSRNWFALLCLEYLILAGDTWIVRRSASFAVEFLWKLVAAGVGIHVLLLVSSTLEVVVVAPVLVLANSAGLGLSWLGRRGAIEVMEVAPSPQGEPTPAAS